MARLSCFYPWLIWSGGRSCPTDLVRATTRQYGKRRTNLFAVSCSTRDGYHYWGGNSCQHHLRIRAPLRQVGLLQLRCRRADATRKLPWVDCSSPASPHAVQPASSRRRLCCPQKTTYHSESVLSHQWVIDMLCSSKGSDGRSEVINATQRSCGWKHSLRLISCRVTPCYLASASLTAGRGRSGAHHSRFVTVNDPALRALWDSGGWTGAPLAHRDFNGHGHMGTSHLITGPSATASRIAVAIPACFAA